VLDHNLATVPPGGYYIVGHVPPDAQGNPTGTTPVTSSGASMVVGIQPHTPVGIGDWLVAVDSNNDGVADRYHLVRHDVASGAGLPAMVGGSVGDVLAITDTTAQTAAWSPSVRTWVANNEANVNGAVTPGSAWVNLPLGSLVYAADTKNWLVKTGTPNTWYTVETQRILHGTSATPPTGVYADGSLYVRHA
jgi:hypothetical protein